MGMPDVMRWPLGAVMGAMGVFGLARLVWVRRADRHLDVAEVLMGAGGLGILAVLPTWAMRPWWAAAFGLDAAWLVAVRALHGAHLRRRAPVRSRRRSWRHYTHQVAANLVMLYMSSAPSATPDASGDGAGGVMAGTAIPHDAIAASAGWSGRSMLTGALVLYFLADACWTVLRLGDRRRSCESAAQRGPLAAALTAPALTVGRHAVMAVGMAVMLLPILSPLF